MILLIFLILGVTFGSFINALVWRLHKKKNWVSERSVCTHCKHVLGPLDLIPVLSWAMLRGKCRYCRKKIEDSPITEILTSALFGISYLVWPFGYSAYGMVALVVWLATLVGLIALLLYDVRWMLLPNKLVAYVTITTIVLTGLLALEEKRFSYIVAAVAGSVIIAGLFWLLFQISGGKWIGGGDVKLAVSLGLLAGTPLKAVLVIFFASCFGTIMVLPSMVMKKTTLMNKIAFGPFLIGATIVVFLWGDKIVSWYTHSVLLLG